MLSRLNKDVEKTEKKSKENKTRQAKDEDITDGKEKIFNRKQIKYYEISNNLIKLN